MLTSSRLKDQEKTIGIDQSLGNNAIFNTNDFKTSRNYTTFW